MAGRKKLSDFYSFTSIMARSLSNKNLDEGKWMPDCKNHEKEVDRAISKKMTSQF